MSEENKIKLKSIKIILQLVTAVLIFLLGLFTINITGFKIASEEQIVVEKKLIKESKPEIVDGIHIETGLKVDIGWEVVNTNCTRCHSATIITNNKFTRNGWKDLIVWMQETQGLWKLGANEDIILDYLEKNYAPGEKKGRRVPLKIKKGDWYVL